MASPCSLQMDGRDEQGMRKAAAAAIAEVQRIEKKYSRYTEDSIVSRINRAAGQDAETAGLLDFGGFGKEYAADRAAAVLLQHGIQHALVNLGGDLHALGERGLPELQGAPWSVHIQQPRPQTSGNDTTLAVLPLARGGLATSGDYERFFMVEGMRYCHVLDPRTGWPVAQWQSVTVLAANTTTAGALTTIAMLKGGDAVA